MAKKKKIPVRNLPVFAKAQNSNNFYLFILTRNMEPGTFSI